jgi:protein-disulfide isomerase
MRKRREIHGKQRRTKKTNRRALMIAIISIAAVAIVALLVFTNQPKPVDASVIVIPTPSASRAQVNSNSMGDPNAPVKIVEYMDFQCPYCDAYWKTTEPQLIDTYVKTGKVYYTSRSMGNFVSDNINRQASTNNTESQLAAQAAYCAADQNKYWEYRDVLFANQQTENTGHFAQNYLEAFAEKLGLDMNTFKSCLSSQKYASKVLQDGVDGTQAITTAPNYDQSGVGTPSFIVNGKLISGNQPFANFQKEIDAALAAAK